MNPKLIPLLKYKDSGLDWAGQIPAHWKTERAKNLFVESHLPVRENDRIVTCFRDGQVTFRENRRSRGFMTAYYETGYQGVRRGQLVIHSMDAFAGAIGISDSDGKCTPEYVVCDPKSSSIVSGYYARLLRLMSQQDYIRLLCSAVRERAPRFRFNHFKDQYFPVPSQDEQAAIVRFLNHADQMIRSFVQSKRRLIELLDEQKLAIISHAVSRGLGHDTLTKPSGIEWLPTIPSHWEVRRAKQVCNAITDCKNRTPELVPDGGYTVVRTTNVRHGLFNLKGSFSTDQKNYAIWTQRGAPVKGDVFFTREAPAGEACLVPEMNNICMGQRMMYFRPDPDQLDSEFLLFSIYGPLVRGYIHNKCSGSTVGHLKLAQVYALPLLWCPIDEQRQIVTHINLECATLKETIARIQAEIRLIREYRMRLIADVVTGKLDVREVVSRLPALMEDVDSEDAPLDLDDAESLDGESTELLSDTADEE